ncbi:MFS transporter [Microtetraspora malaysiensis]|uniref:MFS transporter n=1 Tax=Microtetraspora malaysiensis TaxID=161358 RepID=UPI000833CF55|nr:MFS transporter [Microtetraspora malaysiensis]
MRRDRGFTIFLIAQTLSVAGDMFTAVAIPLLALKATGSVLQMGLLTGLSGVASVITGLFAGVVADRLDRRTVLIVCDVARAVLYGLIPIVWLFAPQVWLLYVIVPLGAVFGMTFQVTYVTVVPALVDPDRITEANGRLSASYAVAGVAGPVLAGVVAGAFGPSIAIGVDAASFAVSALGLCLVRPRPRGDRGPAPAMSGLAGFLDGVRFLWRHPVLRSLTVLLSFIIFVTTGLTDITIYHLKEDLGQTDAAVGTVLAVASAGTIAASALVGRARRRFGFGPCWIGAQTLGGVAVISLGMAGHVTVVAVMMTAFLFATTIAGICSMSLRQEVTPDHLLGRVTSAFWTVHYALGPVGAAVLTAAAEGYGASAVYLAAGAGCLLVAGAAAFTPVRRRWAPEAA